MTDKKLIYIGTVYPQTLVDELVEMKSHVDFPANSLQHALLDGMDAYCNSIKAISSSPLTPYPKIKKCNFKKFAFSHKENGELNDVYVGVLNLPLIRLVSRFWRIRKELKRSLSHDKKENTVLVYGLHTPFLLALSSLKKRIRRACVIVPDLPQFMSGKKGAIYRFAKSIDRLIINRCLKSFDGAVLLSTHMAEKIDTFGKDIAIVDGIFGGTPTDLQHTAKEEKPTILYTGDTAERCGVLDLIEAFKQIDDPDYRLWIRGYGTNLEEVKALIATDPRIVYFPPMSRHDLLCLERKATVLVNPIRPSQEFTRYYFPSKTMEYLASGTPTIMYKLDCLSDEYDQHILYVEEETVESLRDTLVSACNLSAQERHDFGKKAQEFIEIQKTPQIQAKKVIDLLFGR